MIKNLKIILFLIATFFYTQNINAEVVYLNLDQIMKESFVGKSLNKYIESEQKKIKKTLK